MGTAGCAEKIERVSKLAAQEQQNIERMSQESQR